MTNSLYTKVTIPAKYNANNSAPKVYRGFSTVSNNTNNFALYDYELIKQDLMNSFYVRQGERLMQPEIGCIIWDLLFEPLTEQVKNLLVQNVEQILNAEPRVQASNVVISQYDTGLQVEFTLKYTQYNLSENLKLHFDQSNGLVSNSI
jgi:phage baseplate assembly protein W